MKFEIFRLPHSIIQHSDRYANREENLDILMSIRHVVLCDKTKSNLNTNPVIVKIFYHRDKILQFVNDSKIVLYGIYSIKPVTTNDIDKAYVVMFKYEKD